MTNNFFGRAGLWIMLVPGSMLMSGCQTAPEAVPRQFAIVSLKKSGPGNGNITQAFRLRDAIVLQHGAVATGWKIQTADGRPLGFQVDGNMIRVPGSDTAILVMGNGMRVQLWLGEKPPFVDQAQGDAVAVSRSGQIGQIEQRIAELVARLAELSGAN